MAIKKLIVEEFTATAEDFPDIEEAIKRGWSYSYFKDQETGKYYRPKTDFIIEGDALEKMFIEV